MTTAHSTTGSYFGEVHPTTEHYDEHAFDCPCPVGGEVMYRCFYCGRDTSDEDYVLVWLQWSDRDVRCCSVCWERGEEHGGEVPLDYTRDER